MAMADIVVLWVICGPAIFACVVEMADNAGWLRWIDDSRFMTWFGDRLWWPLKHMVEAAALAVLRMGRSAASEGPLSAVRSAGFPMELAGARLAAVHGPCGHERAVPVTLLDGSDEIVAWLCPGCDAQLPGAWK